MKQFSKALLTLALAVPSLSHADGTFFEVNSSGISDNVNITLCLNAAGPMSCENFNVTGLTLSIITTTNHVYTDAGIKVNTPGYTVANLGIDCMPVGNDYCSFSVSKNSPKTIILNGGTKDPRFVYLGNWGNSAVTRCPVDQSTGALGNCAFVYGCPADAGCLEIDSLFSEPTSVVFNSAGTVAFIADNGNDEVYTCQVNSNGDFSNCAEITDPYSFYRPFAISFSPDGTLAYVSQYGSDKTIVKCNVNGSDLGSCINTTYNDFEWATNVIFTDNGNKAYVGNYDLGTIYLCDVDTTPGPYYGDLSGCTTTGGYSDFYYPTQLAINPAGTILYSIWDDNEAVTLCNIDNSDFSLSCSPDATGLSLNDSYGLAINAAGTFAYISDYDLEQAFYCGINSSNGAFENCTQTGSGGIESFGYAMFINFLY